MPYAVISMFPLLRRDGLILPYFALLALFFLLPKSPTKSSRDSTTPFILKACSTVGALVLHLVYLFVQPPVRYPFLFEAFLTSYSFAHFVVLVVYTNWKQWSVPADDEWTMSASSKKINWVSGCLAAIYFIVSFSPSPCSWLTCGWPDNILPFSGSSTVEPVNYSIPSQSECSGQKK